MLQQESVGLQPTVLKRTVMLISSSTFAPLDSTESSFAWFTVQNDPYLSYTQPFTWSHSFCSFNPHSLYCCKLFLLFSYLLPVPLSFFCLLWSPPTSQCSLPPTCKESHESLRGELGWAVCVWLLLSSLSTLPREHSAQTTESCCGLKNLRKE